MFKIASSRAIRHLVFWLAIFFMLTFIYGAGLPGYWFTSGIILIFLPLHAFYFYVIAYVGIPRYFLTRQYFKFFLFLALYVIFVAVAFRLLEITIADPFIFNVLKKRRSNICLA